MPKLYGIWYADYSNSSCGDAVYTNREDAEAVARATTGDLIEFEIDPPLSDEAKTLIRPGERVYHISMDADGNDASGDARYTPEEPEDGLSVRVDGGGRPRRIVGETWAKDKQHAIKIINERRARWIASGSHVGRPAKHPDAALVGWHIAV